MQQVRRKSFAVEQLLALECHYMQNKYLRGHRRSLLAKQLNLTEAQVKIWFQNRRAKENRSRHETNKTEVALQACELELETSSELSVLLIKQHSDGKSIAIKEED